MLGFERNVGMGLMGRSGREYVQSQGNDVNKAENCLKSRSIAGLEGSERKSWERKIIETIVSNLGFEFEVPEIRLYPVDIRSSYDWGW